MRVHQGLEVRSKIPWSLLPLKNASLKEGKLLISCTKFIIRDSPGISEGKESACHVGDPASTSGLGRFPWRRKWKSTPVFLPGEFHGQRSLADYSAGSQTWLSNYTYLQGGRADRESASHSVVSDSLQPHGLYSPWNSPGQNTGVGSHSLLQGIYLTQESTQSLLHCRRILY